MRRIRAVICDVYGTLLEVGPPPPDAEARWTAGWERHFPGEARSGLDALSSRCREIVAGDHAAAEAMGVRSPEVGWAEVMGRAVPSLRALDAATREEFLFMHAGLLRTTRLMPGAADFLRAAGERGLALGIASNAQRYTLRECDEALATAGLSRGIFDPELTLWSFELGFSKPNLHVFRILAARLAHRGVAGDAVLMVGDRLDNDIEPARAMGWRTALIDGSEASWRAVGGLVTGDW